MPMSSSLAWLFRMPLGKPVVLYKEDVRSTVAGRDNPLIVGQACFRTTNDLELLGEALREKISEMSLDPDWETPCPPHLRQVLQAGERLWSELTKLGHERPTAAVSEIVCDLFDGCLESNAARSKRS